MPARSSADLIAWAPRSVAGSEASAPDSFPMGVRAEETMTEPGMAGLRTWGRFDGMPGSSDGLRLVRYRDLTAEEARQYGLPPPRGSP